MSRQHTVVNRVFTLTPQQEAGLRILAKVHPHPAHISNTNDPNLGHLHWKVAQALREQGLTMSGGFEAEALNQWGRALARQWGLTLREPAS